MASQNLAACGLAALLVVASPAFPDEPAAKSAGSSPRWRVLAGPSISAPAFSTSYVSRYPPPFEFVPHTSAATQTLPLDAEAGWGVLLGIERTLGPHVGLQFSAHYGGARVAGLAGQYALSVRYTSRPPPSNDPLEVTLQRSEAQPEADGRLKTLVLSFDVVACAELGSRGRLGVSTGPAWFRTRGRAERLVYTSYFMGGHSTVFSEDYLVSLEFPASSLGFDVGGFAELAMGGVVRVRLDLRYFRGSARDAAVTLGEILNANQTIRSTELSQVERGLAPTPVRVDPSFPRAALALTFGF